MSLARQLTADCQEWATCLMEGSQYHDLRVHAFHRLYAEMRHEMVMWIEAGDLQRHGPGWWVIMGLQ